MSCLDNQVSSWKNSLKIGRKIGQALTNGCHISGNFLSSKRVGINKIREGKRDCMPNNKLT